jgi:Acyclic terpene utilisation family protein AtuA
VAEPSAGVLRVGNCSGFYGDRLSAMREMLEGGDLDILTGDYLAELTMLILGRDRMKDPALGYARTFVRQVEDCLGLALERGVKIVANAGGLNPCGLADKVREVAAGLGLDPVVAHVEGDDLLDRVAKLGLPGKPLTANAYLGGFGIAAALRAGADVVVTGRVTDASLVVGPAVARFGWAPTSYDELAGAVVAGHVIECGTQATGGNYSGFTPWRQPLGFPVAEVAADGSCVVTKHPGSGGEVTVDTVTAQLVYEIQSAVYLGPDVSTHLATVALAQDGPDRVRVSGVRGSAPPDTLKVCVNELGGFRNSAELVLVGLDIDAKAAWARSQVSAALEASPAGPPASVEWTLARTDHADADTEEGASARLRVTVRDQDPDRVGKAFTAPLVELALASYPGFTLTGPPAPGTPYGVYRAAYVDRADVEEKVVVDGTRVEVPQPSLVEVPQPSLVEVPQPSLVEVPEPLGEGLETTAPERASDQVSRLAPLAPQPAVSRLAPQPATRRVPLGTIAHARSGDKGGNANVGVWARDARNDRAAWLLGFLTPDRVRELLPEAVDLDVEVHPLPNLGAVNVVLPGLLGEGVAASSRFDPQAKAVGEWLRSRYVDVPEALL